MERKSSLGLWIILMILMLSYCANSTFYNKQINTQLLKEIFDSKGCVTGYLAMAPTVPMAMPEENHVTSSATETENVIYSHAYEATENDESNVGNEKTSMSLVNELASFNKVEYQYVLTNEEGPPHKRIFTIILKIGTEEHTGDGTSIKKAQQAAASIALEKTMYKHPPQKKKKPSRRRRGSKENITPTDELNILAMKRGESIIYTAVESTQHHDNFVNYHHRGIYTQSYNEDNGYSYKSEKTSFYRAASNQRSDQKCYGDKQPLYKVVVKVGKREFSGEGISAQEARHDAASKALQVLLSLPVNESCLAKNSTCDGSNSGGSGTTNFDYSTNLKSPVSLVHEIALKRNLHVQFEIISEEGPSHMKTFVTQCQVGDKFHTIGEGSSKKESKKRAAEKMLELLRTLPSIYPVDSLPKEKRKTKKKSKKLIKDIQIRTDKQDQKFEANTQEDVNPISRLVQIQQAKKEKEPVFTLKDERGTPGRQEFIMEVKVGEHSFISSGPSKKIAKRNAAEGLLQQLGYASSTVTSSGHSLPQQHTPKHVKLGGEKPSTPSTSSKFGGVSGRQIVPGLHLMNDNKATNNQHTPHKGINLKTSATIAKEYLSNGNSHTADALAEHKKAKLSPVVRPTEKLMNLAQVLSFQVQFSDFPKGNQSEYLSLVSLAIDPAQVCLGVGITTELSHDQAALNALKSLSEIGWDSITPVSTKKEDQIGNFPPPSIIQNDEIYLNLPDEGTNYLNEK